MFVVNRMAIHSTVSRQNFIEIHSIVIEKFQFVPKRWASLTKNLAKTVNVNLLLQGHRVIVYLCVCINSLCSKTLVHSHIKKGCISG